MNRLIIVPLLLLAFVACDKFNPFDVATKDDLAALTPTEPPSPDPGPPCVAKIEPPLYLGGLSVQLFDGSDNCGSREWHFGDGETSEVEDPIHAYPACGEYIATLIAWAVVEQPDRAQVRLVFECPDVE